VEEVVRKGSLKKGPGMKEKMMVESTAEAW
jgi:hypothetical protein